MIEDLNLKKLLGKPLHVIALRRGLNVFFEISGDPCYGTKKFGSFCNFMPNSILIRLSLYLYFIIIIILNIILFTEIYVKLIVMDYL